MKSLLKLGCGVALILMLSTAAAYACHVSGRVLCDRSDKPLSGMQVEFVATSGDPFTGSATTDENGEFTMALPVVEACYTASVVLGSQQRSVKPASGERSICIRNIELTYTLDDFSVEDPACEMAATAGSTWGELKSTYK